MANPIFRPVFTKWCAPHGELVNPVANVQPASKVPWHPSTMGPRSLEGLGPQLWALGETAVKNQDILGPRIDTYSHIVLYHWLVYGLYMVSIWIIYG